MRRRWIVVALVVLAVPVLVLMGLFGYSNYQDQLRIRDAMPAFDPLIQLKPLLLSQPFGTRYCRYVVEFPPDSLLTDDNVGQLQCLNRLPQQNTLDLTIHTKRITDASIPVLASLNTVDLLGVWDTSITDDGIAELEKLMPNTEVPPRRQIPSLQEP